MKKNYLIILFCLVLLLLNSCTKSAKIIKEEKVNDNLIVLQIKVKSLQIKIEPMPQNLIQTDIVNLYIYLPPSYNDSSKRYPVIYYLHGYGEGPRSILGFLNSIQNYIQNNKNKEMIIVSVSGGNSFYVNSPVIGNWEDYLVNDVINLIDKKYRTIAKSGSRGISGFSMGGYASINLALKHPDIFSVMYSLCPGLFDTNGLENAMHTWDKGFIRSYGSAFSPNLDKPELFDVPVFDGSANDKKIIENWNNGFGNGVEKIKNYLGNSSKLKAIKIDYGTKDFYKWIPQGCIYFLKLLDKNNIKYESEAIKMGHTITNETVEKNMMPFFARNLKFN